MERSSLIVKGESYAAVEQLNKLLSDGWRVTHTCSMPSAGGSNTGLMAASRTIFEPQCLVILEKL